MTSKKVFRCGWLTCVLLATSLFIAPAALADSADENEGASPPSTLRWQKLETVQARLDALKDASLDELRAAEKEALEAMEASAKAASDVRRAAMEAYRNANENAPEVQAIRGEIQALEAKIADTIRQLPEVKALYDSIDEANITILEATEFRRQLGRLIAERSKEAQQ